MPYDVVSTEEAHALAGGEPLSFLHVTRAEIDLPPARVPYDARVYEQSVRNFETTEAIRADAARGRGRRSTSTGCAWAVTSRPGSPGCFSLDEYENGLIKKHEKTRKDKEDDRTRHMLELRAQTGVVFLTYRASAAVRAIARESHRRRRRSTI